MIDRDVFLGYRLFAVRMGLTLSWLGTLGFIWVANRGPGPIAPGATTEIIVLAAMTVLLTFAPWQSVLAGEIGDAYIGIWSVVTVGGLIAVHDLSSGVPFSVAFIVVVVFAAATLVRSGYLTVIAASAFAGYALALDRAGADLSTGGTRLRLVAFAVAALLAIAASVGVTRVFRSAARRLRDLESQSSDLEQQRVELNELYSISGTIGLGGTLAEIIPVLMGRIVNSVGARFGLVVLFRPTTTTSSSSRRCGLRVGRFAPRATRFPSPSEASFSACSRAVNPSPPMSPWPQATESRYSMTWIHPESLP